MDPRYLTGPAMIIVGLFFLFQACRLWFVHPINRVMRLGRYVTEEGLVAILNLRSLLLFYGLAGLEGGLYRCYYWFGNKEVDDPNVRFLGSAETMLMIICAYLSLTKGYHLWRTK